MNKPTSISRRIGDCLDAFERRDDEASLVHFFPALDKTAKRRRPRDGVGNRIKRFLDDQAAVSSAFALGNVIGGISINGFSFSDAIYKFGRTSIAHEGELDPRLQIVDSGGFTVGPTVWRLPRSYIPALCVAVIIAPENAQERLGRPVALRALGKEWVIDELWGAEARVIAELAQLFPVGAFVRGRSKT